MESLANKEAIFTAFQVASITGGKLIGNPDLSFFSVEVDSRKISKGALFVALKGDRVDGHAFLRAALEKGANLFLVNEESVDPNDLKWLVEAKKTIIAVKDPLSALQQLAAAHLRRFPNLIRIGITGSSGKTTTKEILGTLLQEKYSVCMTEGNLNSEIGLPLMALRVTKKNQVLILEMGIDHIGEMEKLVAILQPQYALITFIGTAHIGRFGSQAALSSEKGKIFSLFDEDSHGYVNAEDSLAINEGKKYRGQFVSYGLSSGGQGKRQLGPIEIESLGLRGWNLHFEGQTALFPLMGEHNVYNLAAAYWVAKELALDEKEILQGVQKIKPLFGRNCLKEINFDEKKLTLIEDCYNANGESVSASLHFFDSLDYPGRKILLLGAMKELGNQSERIHREVGALILESSIDLVLLIGEETLWVYQELMDRSFPGEACYFENRFELGEEIQKRKADGDLWLFKGSRSMALEEFELNLKK